MENKNIFEIATRKAFRFTSTKGLLSVEDLWKLKRTELNNIYKGLASSIKKDEEMGLMKEKTEKDEDASIMMEIIKYIYEVKDEEEKAKANEKVKAEQKQLYMSILKQKEEEELKNLSADELRKKIDEM